MKTQFTRIISRRLPDGRLARLFPFHFSLEGISSKILCRDNQDYDVFVKILAVCSLRKNVIIVIYIVVSNHAHAVILAESQKAADAYGEEVKRMFSMYYSRKHNDRSALKGLDAKSIYIDSDRYLRNAICYVVRNANDNLAESVTRYKWSGFRAMFCGGSVFGAMPYMPSASDGFRFVKGLTKRESRSIMHTGDCLRNVEWMLNPNGELEPASFCDWRYLEAAFYGDQVFFLRTIGCVNVAEMNQRLVANPRVFQADGDFLLSVNEISHSWYDSDIHKLSLTQKIRLITYASHCFRTTPRQLARAFELPLAKILEILGR